MGNCEPGQGGNSAAISGTSHVSGLSSGADVGDREMGPGIGGTVLAVSPCEAYPVPSPLFPVPYIGSR